MSVCIFKFHHFCDTCKPLGVPIPNGNPEHKAVEVNDLCYPCVRGSKASYVGPVSRKFDSALIEAVEKVSPWCKAHPFIGRSEDENT